MRTLSDVDMSSKPATVRMLIEFYFFVSDALYRTFAPRNKYGLTSKQMSKALMIARNGNAGILLARLYACSGCGISDAVFDDLISDHQESLGLAAATSQG